MTIKPLGAGFHKYKKHKKPQFCPVARKNPRLLRVRSYPAVDEKKVKMRVEGDRVLLFQVGTEVKLMETSSSSFASGHSGSWK